MSINKAIFGASSNPFALAAQSAAGPKFGQMQQPPAESGGVPHVSGNLARPAAPLSLGVGSKLDLSA